MCGGEGRYLNISFKGCPELINKVRLIRGRFLDSSIESEASPNARCRYVGLVSQKNVESLEASPNILRGNGCCGIIVPEGSISPGRMWTGITRPISRRCADRLSIG